MHPHLCYEATSSVFGLTWVVRVGVGGVVGVGAVLSTFYVLKLSFWPHMGLLIF